MSELELTPNMKKEDDILSQQNMRFINKELEEAKIKNKELSEQNRFKKLEELLTKSKYYSDFLLKKLDNLRPLGKKDLNIQKSSNVIKNYKSNYFIGTLKDYQIEGVEWLKILYENGINGILADEMGLGKTVQCIAFFCHLIEHQVPGPYIVVAPLSTLPNWISEFKRFAPELYFILYHGSNRTNALRKIKHALTINKYPIVLTSYDIAIHDQFKLKKFDWRYLVIDEGHRIKNFNCKLFTILKSFYSANRLLMTGTPLQNNLEELWSLLNFLVPEIFDDLSVFVSWFDISALTRNIKESQLSENDHTNEEKSESTLSNVLKERQQKVVNMIHQILAPFLLRRTKMDVDFNIPPKQEILVYTPLSDLFQDHLYRAIFDMDIESNIVVMRRHTINDLNDVDLAKNFKHWLSKYHHSDTLSNHDKKDRSKRHCKYDIKMVNAYIDTEPIIESDLEDETESDHENSLNETKSSLYLPIVTVLPLINSNNIWMALRKCSNHPYLIDQKWPYPVNDELIQCSGKMVILDQILPRLKLLGHKVLLFSQMTSMLDILEEYCEYRHFKYARLDGSTSLDDRKKDIERFQHEKLHKEKNDQTTDVYLISTRAGGLGINLTAASCVIIFDSDWNPQSDLQAQDRCHRIGQDKPVVVYRLVTEGTVDQIMVDRAFAKKKLEKMIIPKEKFKDTRKNFSTSKVNIPFSAQEIMNILNELEYTSIYKTRTQINGKLSPLKANKLHSPTSKSPVKQDPMKLTEQELRCLLDWPTIFPQYYKQHPEKLKEINAQLPYANLTFTKRGIRPVFKILKNDMTSIDE